MSITATHHIPWLVTSAVCPWKLCFYLQVGKGESQFWLSNGLRHAENQSIWSSRLYSEEVKPFLGPKCDLVHILWSLGISGLACDEHVNASQTWWKAVHINMAFVIYVSLKTEEKWKSGWRWWRGTQNKRLTGRPPGPSGRPPGPYGEEEQKLYIISWNTWGTWRRFQLAWQTSSWVVVWADCRMGYYRFTFLPNILEKLRKRGYCFGN